MIHTTAKISARPGRGFRIFLVTLCAVCAVASAAGLWFVYRMTCAYEQSTPEYCVRETLTQFQQQELSGLLAAGGLVPGEFESSSAPASRLAELLEGPWHEIDFRRRTNQEYSIVSGKNRLATLLLRPSSEKGAFGFGKWELERLSLAIEPLPARELLVPAGVDRISLNGKPIGTRYRVDAALPVEEYGVLPEGIPPALTSRYRIEGLYCEPTIEAASALGDVSVQQDGASAILSLQPDPALVAELTPRIIEGSQRYANYITQDATWSQLQPYFLKGTEFYTHLRQFFNGWYSTHDSNRFSNVLVQDFSMIDQQHLSCRISFDYIITMGARTFEYPSTYQVYLIKTDGGWKISNLLVQ